MITKENYEAYFLDYIEGNLSQKNIDMLLLFLDKNPDLKNDLEDYSEITLTPNESSFDNSTLKQTDLINEKITSDNFEVFAIANLENDLSEKKRKEFSVFINNDKPLYNQYKLVKQSKLIANKSIIFNDKEGLKKSIPLFIPYSRIAGIAAILLLMIYFFIPEIDNSTNNTIALIDINKKINHKVLNENLVQNQKKEIVDSEISESEISESKNVIKSINTIDENHYSFNNNGDIDKINTSQKIIESIKLANYKTINLNTNKNESYRSLTASLPINNVNPYYEDNNNNTSIEDGFLTPKEFLASIFKKKVLKTEDDNPEIEIEDFNNTLASISNDKVSFKKSSNNTRLISIQTKNFSFEKKISNKL